MSTPVSEVSEVPSFVREAVREKATRELSDLHRRSSALSSLRRVQGSLEALAADLNQQSSLISGVIDEAPIQEVKVEGRRVPQGHGAKLKKARRAVDEAKSLIDELAVALDVDSKLSVLGEAERSISSALLSAGIDPNSLVVGQGGDAQ